MLWTAHCLMSWWASVLPQADGSSASRAVSTAILLFSLVMFIFASTNAFLFVEAFFWALQMVAAFGIMATAPPSGGVNSSAQTLIISGNIRAIAAISVSLLAK